MILSKLLHPLSAVVVLFLVGCGEDSPPAAATQPPVPAAAPAPANVAAADIVRMKIDGVEWVADRDYLCAVHPPGYSRAVIVGAALGPKDANEQTFSLLIGNVDAPGTLRLDGPLSETQAVQLGNLDATRYLNGGALGFKMRVELLRMDIDPVVIEARFDGTLNSSNGATLQITEGYVRCAD